MQYRNAQGKMITVATSRPTIMQFIVSPTRLRFNLSSKIAADEEARKLGVANLINYLAKAVETGNCIIVEQDSIMFDIICKKITARIDSEMLECLCVWKTSI